MADVDSNASNDKKLEKCSLKRKRSVTDQTGKDVDIMSSDDDFVSDGDSDLGFLADDAADQSYLSAPRADSYSGLDITLEGPEGPWIRLLRLQPAQYHEPLSCVLIRTPLYEGRIRYVALSYSWEQGFTKIKKKDLPTSVLKLQHGAIDISEHLVHALRRLRDERLPIYVWIDAICINQHDLGEKANQIPLMAQIYGNAAEVRIWLGEPPALPTTDNNPSAITTERVYWVCTQDRPWWSRLWVVQERIDSTQCPVILLGSQKLHSKHFIRLLDEEAPRFSNVSNSLRSLYEAWQKQNDTNSAREPLLVRLLQTKHLGCEDFHDRAYALLSLIPERDVACFAVDYRKSDYNLALDIFNAALSADEWAYGDLKLMWNLIVQIHEQSRGSESNGPQKLHIPRISPALRDRITAYEQMTSCELENMCFEPIAKSQLASGPRLHEHEGPGNSMWIHNVFCDWWTAKLRAYDTHNTLQRLCFLYSKFPKIAYSTYGVYEWRTPSGVCGFYVSPIQDMNANVLFSMHDNIALVIDDKKGTYPGYVVRGPTEDTPSKQHKVLLDFASPSVWDWEPPKRMDVFNFSESLSVTTAEPAEYDLSARNRYSIGPKINERGPDAQQWKIHLATNARFLTP